jgi:hypothetical protein
MAAGQVNSISVPAPCSLQTSSFPPKLLARSRMPGSPQCEFRPDRTTSGSIPQPSSRTNTRVRLRRYSTSTSMFVAPECRNALTTASRPIRKICSRIPGFNAFGFPATKIRNRAPLPDVNSFRSSERACSRLAAQAPDLDSPCSRLSCAPS